MELSDTISLMEAIWTAFCIPGLYYAILLLLRVTGDLYSLRAKKINSIREYAAMTTVFMFGALALVQFTFVAIGALAMMLKNNPYSRGQLVIATAFIFVSFVLDGMLFITERRRGALIAKIEQIEGGM